MNSAATSQMQIGESSYSPDKTMKVDISPEKSMSVILGTTACTQTRLNETNEYESSGAHYYSVNETSHFGNITQMTVGRDMTSEML